MLVTDGYVPCHIYTNKYHCRSVCLFVCLSVCLSVCLFVRVNLSRLKSERHETRHVGPLGTWKCHRPTFFLNFDLEV